MIYRFSSLFFQLLIQKSLFLICGDEFNYFRAWFPNLFVENVVKLFLFFSITVNKYKTTAVEQQELSKKLL